MKLAIRQYLLIILVLSLLMLPAPAMAYKTWNCPNGKPLKWKKNKIVLGYHTTHVDPVSFQTVTIPTSTVNELNAAVAHWNRVSNVQIALKPFPMAANYWEYDIMLYWRNTGNAGTTSYRNIDKDCANDATLGSVNTADVKSGPNIDINDWLTTTSNSISQTSKYKGTQYFDSTTKTVKTYNGIYHPLRAILMHEIGHALGLQHENRYYNEMGDQDSHVYVSGTDAMAYAGSDAVSGIMSLYGTRPGAYDVGVSHWKYSGPYGDASVHAFTDIFWPGTDTGPVGSLPKTWKLNKGYTYEFEFTFENNSAANRDAISTEVKFYLSDNTTITSSDRFLGGGTYSGAFTGPLPQTRRATVLIPNDVKSGRYFFGVIVKPSDLRAETNTANNTSWLPVTIYNTNEAVGYDESGMPDTDVHLKFLAQHSGLCLSVDTSRYPWSNGDKLMQWACHEDSSPWNQHLVLRKEGSYYRIVAAHSGKCLDVDYWSASQNGVQIQQWDCLSDAWGNWNQLWNLIQVSDGVFALQNVYSGKCIDIEAALESEGARALQWDCHFGPNQLFSVESGE